MRLVIQRVTSASVVVGGATVGSISRGLMVLVGIGLKDRASDAAYLARKLLNLRLWDDPKDSSKAWSASVMQRGFDVLLVSQFTLYAIPKGNKPDFHLAMPPDSAAAAYADFLALVTKEYKGGRVQNGVFGADMQVSLVNDGPVTITLDTDDMDFSKENEKEDKQKAKWQKQAKDKAAQSPSASCNDAVGAPAAVGSETAVPAAAESPASPSPSPAAATSAAVAPLLRATAVSSSSSPVVEAQSVSSPAASSPSPTPVAATPSAVSAAAPRLSPLASPSFASMVGGTSLVHLRHISAETGCNIYGKAEYENPGGSVKDRPALAIIAAAEAAGTLVHGEPGWIVEGTAGNTGLGLTLAGAARGYRTLVVMADNNSQEKKDLLRSLGASVVEVPMVPFSNPNNYVHVAARIHAAMSADLALASPPVRCVLADQWSNAANRKAHFDGTGPEIWRQTQGRIDAFCCGVGTGGTLSGVSLYLKSRSAAVKSVLIDPEGSCLKSYFETGVMASTGSSIAEGIGQGRLCENLTRDGFRPDSCVRVLDSDALPVTYALLAKEGISVGSSSAINVCGAYQLAKQLGPGHTIVTMLCDAGTRYQSKMYNDAFLRSKGLPTPEWLDAASAEVRQQQASLDQWRRGAIVEVPAPQ